MSTTAMMVMRPGLESGIGESMFITYIFLNYYTNVQVFTESRYARHLDVSNDQHRNPHNLTHPKSRATNVEREVMTETGER